MKLLVGTKKTRRITQEEVPVGARERAARLMVDGVACALANPHSPSLVGAQKPSQSGIGARACRCESRQVRSSADTAGPA
jgi:hypothetical protein